MAKYKSQISCRLEYLYVSNNLINSFTDTNITEITISDHSAVTILLTTSQSKRDPGFWKFNNSLLTDEKFTESQEKKIPEFKIKYSYLNDKSLLWEMIKMEIRAFTISFAKHKAAKTSDEEKELLQQLNALQRQLDLSFSKPVLEKLIFVKGKA